MKRSESVRAADGGVFANRYIFIWQLLARGSALVCTYVGTSRRARQKLRLSGQTERSTRERAPALCLSPRLDPSSLLPPSFDLESINGASDFMFLKCRWGAPDRPADACPVFLGAFAPSVVATYIGKSSARVVLERKYDRSASF